jgi:diguanylate cyclase (GGDEF)-like protein
MTDPAVLETVFRDATDLLVVLNPNRRLRAANPAFRALVRSGRDGTDFMDLVSRTGREHVLSELVKAAGGHEVLLAVAHPDPDGHDQVVEYRFFPVEGGLVAGIGRLRSEPPADEALDRARAELREKARMLDEIQLELTQVPFIDPVTGVWNRLQVIERLTGEWSRTERYGSPIACLLVEAEGLDDVRRRDGAAVGDEVLKTVARRLKTVVRDHDIVGRYGGDKFVIVAVHSDAEGARALARRIGEAVADEPVAVMGRSFPLSIRIGGATNRSEGVEILEDLFTVAASALQDARTRAEPVYVVDDSGG